MSEGVGVLSNVSLITIGPTRPAMNRANSPRDMNFDSTQWFSKGTVNDLLLT